MLPMVRQAHHEDQLIEKLDLILSKALILSLSKDEATFSGFFSILPDVNATAGKRCIG